MDSVHAVHGMIVDMAIIRMEGENKLPDKWPPNKGRCGCE